MCCFSLIWIKSQVGDVERRKMRKSEQVWLFRLLQNTKVPLYTAKNGKKSQNCFFGPSSYCIADLAGKQTNKISSFVKPVESKKA